MYTVNTKFLRSNSYQNMQITKTGLYFWYSKVDIKHIRRF